MGVEGTSIQAASEIVKTGYNVPVFVPDYEQRIDQRIQLRTIRDISLDINDVGHTCAQSTENQSLSLPR